MIGIRAVNHLGASLEISNINYPVTEVEGLTPATAQINTAGAGIADGTFFNSSYVGQRNIVITVVPNGPAEDARLELYSVFKPKYNVRLYFTTENRYVYIDGYVESFEGSLFENRQTFQISVICPNPFFIDADSEEVEQSITVDAFTFPASFPEAGRVLGIVTENIGVTVRNLGEETTGVIITLEAREGLVVNPTIYNETTREAFALNVTIQKGERINIDTRRGQKTVTLNRDGEIVNIINLLERGSKWLTVAQGNNLLTIQCEAGTINAKVTYEIETLYEGV